MPLSFWLCAGSQVRGGASLAGAAFCCGLALWDKAVFVWVLGALLAALLGYLVNEDSADQPRSLQAPLEQAAFQPRSFAGEHRANALEPAFLAALALLPLLLR